jgi:pyridoxine 4-dehydrogenase
LIENAIELGVVGLDIAYNYGDFGSHRALAEVADDLLDQFIVSTKVGYFRNGHTLDPARLLEAIQRSVDDLGRPPDVLFLHNPEHTLRGAAVDLLVDACGVLADAVTSGLCGAWGIATWNPRPVLDAVRGGARIRPDVMLIRAGVSVSEPTLTASEALCHQVDVSPDRRWGMSPFGGSTTDPAWQTTNFRALLLAGQPCSNLQAAFRAAYELPPVARIAVGTNRADHLRDVAAATELAVDHHAIDRYRTLLTAAR